MRLLLPGPVITTPSRRAGGVATSVSLHACVIALVLLAPLAAGLPSVSPEVKVEFVSALLDVPQKSSGDTELFEEKLKQDDPSDGGAPAEADGTTFDIDKIKERQDTLFPFITVGLSFLERIDTAVASEQRGLGNPFDVGQSSSRPPLELSAEALQRVIDNAYTRRHRFQSFGEIRAMLDKYDANRGQMPDVIRQYLDQNLLQPSCDGVRRDPRFWAMLENASDHMAFIEMVRKYVWEHPVSKTTTELLFLLDELTQASRSAMLMLIDTRPERDLQFTQAVTGDGFEIATKVQRDYLDWLARRNIVNADYIKIRFDQVRINILTTILASTPGGYRAGDARYLVGEVLIDMGDVPGAMEQWKAIKPDPADSYFKTYSIARDALASAAPDGRALSRMLETEYGKWRMAAIDRLRQFHRRCDSY